MDIYCCLLRLKWNLRIGERPYQRMYRNSDDELSLDFPGRDTPVGGIRGAVTRDDW